MQGFSHVKCSGHAVFTGMVKIKPHCPLPNKDFIKMHTLSMKWIFMFEENYSVFEIETKLVLKNK